jgi:cytochrome P450
VTEGIPSPALNPLDPAVARDPYPLFARLREHDPIYRDEVMNAWLVTSFDAFLAIVQDPRLRSGSGKRSSR